MSNKRNLIDTLTVSLFIVVFCGGATAQEQPEKGTEMRIAGHKSLVWASSELESHNRYSVEKAFDDDPNTAWVEGSENAGEGSFIMIKFDEPVTIDGFSLLPGYVKNPRTFAANSVPRKIELNVDGRLIGNYTISYDIDFVYSESDTPKARSPQIEGCYHTGATINTRPRSVIFSKPVSGTIFKLTVTDALVGNRYKDLAITEWKLLTNNNSDCLFDCRIAKIIKSLRSEAELMKYISISTEVEDLRTKYLNRSAVLSYVYTNTPPEYYSKEELFGISDEEFFHKTGVERRFPYFARVNKEVRGIGNTPYERFLRYTKRFLLDAATTIDTRGRKIKIIGVRSFTYGDGEWREFYPTIVLDEELKIISMSEVSETDGSPGCHDVIPRTIGRQ